MFILQGTYTKLEIRPDDPVRIIGERINPSGKPKLMEVLIHKNWKTVAEEAVRQAAAGADIIDINVGGKGLDEAVLLPDAVRAVNDAADIPLCIDTRIPAALEAALRICKGRPLVNSISAEHRALAGILPVAAEHRVPVIALCMGQDGIPRTAEDRLCCALDAMNAAVKAGIPEEDVIFDPLVMTVGADDQAARVALETIRLLRTTFPHNSITGGASNVSFGMPARSELNACFLAAATAFGMNLPITDPTDTALRFAVLAGTLFSGRDKRNRQFMRTYRELFQKEPVQ